MVKKTNQTKHPTKNELGVILSLYRQKRYKECLGEVKDRLKFFPNSADLLNFEGMAYTALNKDDEAVLSYQKVIKADPSHAGAYYNMGIVFKRNGRIKEAIEKYKKAIFLNPAYVQAHNNLGVIYKNEGDYEKAIELFTRVVELKPDHRNAHFNLGLIYFEMRKGENAVKYYEIELSLYPDSPRVSFELGKAKVLLKEFKIGWQNYEYRWKIPPTNQTKWPFYKKAVWNGEKNKRVALWREQGIGDEIAYLGLLPEVQEICSSLSVYVDPRLLPLCERSLEGISFFPYLESEKNMEYDYHLPLGSLPRLFRNDIRDFDKTTRGYLRADKKKVQSMRIDLGLDSKQVIGISWKSFDAINSSNKNLSLIDYKDLFEGMDVVLLNLQYGDVDDEIREFREKTGIEIICCNSIDNREDLDGLAALIEVCDLVVSTSNVTIHLAGALGKDTFLLLPLVTNTWLHLDLEKSLWYPSLTLYRQNRLNNWKDVLERVQKDLRERFKRL